MIHILSDRVTRAYSTEVEPKFDITLAEWRVILMLNQHPGTTANKITDRWSMEKIAVNRAIWKLDDAAPSVEPEKGMTNGVMNST